MVGRKLKNQGWKVVRFWEHDIKKNPEKILKKISNIFSNYVLLKKHDVYANIAII